MGLDSLLKGKKKTYKKDKLAGTINQAGAEGLSNLRTGAQDLSSVYSESPDQLNERISGQIGRENNALLSGVNDAMKLSDRLTAQRGMGSSSIGLGNLINQRRQYSQAVGLNNASLLDRIRSARIENAQGKMGIGQNLFAIKQGAGPIQMNTIKKREGGLGGLVGAGLGAAMGGAKGAEIGMQLGNAYQNS